MNGNQKEVAWNFLYFYHTKGAGQPARTIEYRRPAGSRELKEVYSAITMSVVFCYGAITRIKSELFEMMCNTPVVWEKDVIFSDEKDVETPLPNSLVTFGGKKLGQFNQWMTEDAKVYGLQKFQITQEDTELGTDGFII